jgi:hypothetical protein
VLGLCPQIECGRLPARPSVTNNQKSASGTLSVEGAVGRNSGRIAPFVRATEKAEYAALFRPTRSELNVIWTIMHLPNILGDIVS